MNDTLHDALGAVIREAQRAAAAIAALAILGLVAVALFGTPRAEAQTPAPVYVDAKIGAGYECVPGYYGEQWPGSVHKAEFRTDNGWHAFAFCVGAGGKPVYVYKTCTHDEGQCPSRVSIHTVIANLVTTAVGKDRAAVVSTWAKLNPEAYHCGPIRYPGAPAAAPLPGRAQPGTARGRACDELIAAMHKDWPTVAAPVVQPPPVPSGYAVKANGTAATRPAYTLVGNVRGLKEVARATVGQACNLTRPKLASGSDWWAEFGPDFVAGNVALCAAPK